MTSPSPDLSGRLLKGRYRVERALAEGGMGAVYLAMDEDLQRRVVVKVPRVELLADLEFRARFEREIRSLIGLDHPNVVKLLDAGEDDGVPYVILQHLAGGDLGDRLTASPSPSTCAEVLEWLPAVARALDFIHRRGFVHRDIKPGNIMFDADGNAHIGDFGIARAVGSQDVSVTQTGNLVGSPRFMPPEVGLGGALSPAYDQYSLAIAIYHAVSGRLPHEADSPVVLMTKKVLEPARPLRDVAPDVPPAAAAAIMRALSREPGERFASCEELASAFAAGARTGHPLRINAPVSADTVVLTATGELAAAQGEAARRRRRRQFAAALLLVLAVAAGWLAHLAVRARTQREEKAAQAQREAEDKAAIAATPGLARRAEPDISSAGPARSESILLEGAGSHGVTWTDGAIQVATAPTIKTAAATASKPPAATQARPPAAATAAPPPAPAPAPANAPVVSALPKQAPALRSIGRNAQGFELVQRSIDGGRMVRIPATTFLMGSEAPGDGPPHRVALSTFLIDETEITWAQWKRYMKAHGILRAKIPSFNPGDEHPVVNVDWEAAQSYCEWVGGRLPTEAEWELAARGPRSLTFPWGLTWEDGHANWAGSHDGFPNTAPVGSFPSGASPFGLLDMSGNVAEWIFDHHGESPEAGSFLEDPSGPAVGTQRGVRGGTWSQSNPAKLSGSHRASADPTVVYANFGMRCALRN